jgi:hypothetical protein
MSFSAVMLCVSSHWVFGVVHVKCKMWFFNFLIVDLQEQNICMNFSSNSGKLYQKLMKYSEQLLVPMP